MTKDELEDIINKLNKSSNQDKAYFGLVEDVPHEYCIRANEDGLKLFAVELLDTINNKKNILRSLASKDLPWFDDEVEVQFIELTDMTKPDIIKPIQKRKSNHWTIQLGLWGGLLILIYLIIAGIIFTIKLV